MPYSIHHGDAGDVLRTLTDASVDAVVTDPPYALGFMGKTWDTHTPAGFQAWCQAWAAECLRVLKPGGHLLAFGGTRTVHRMTCAIEDAGFEIRDGIDWIYGQGFPKSLNVSEAIDRHRAARGAAAVDAVRAWLNARRVEAGLSLKEVNDALGAATNGGGLASAWMTNPTSKGLPDWERWCQLKSLLHFGDEMDSEVQRLHTVAAGDDRPVVGHGADAGRRAVGILHSPGSGVYSITASATDQARNWEGWGTALKPAREPIVLARKPPAGTVAANVLAHGTGALNIDACRVGGNAAGRWPTNVTLSHLGNTVDGDLCADGCMPGCPVAELDEQSGPTGARAPVRGTETSAAVEPGTITNARRRVAGAFHADAGGASRFFPVFRYQAKAPTRERPTADGVTHPTVKPLALMRWLVTLVTPPGGTVLDPFAGSGTTVEACLLDGFPVIAIEREAVYLPLIQARADRTTA